MMRMCLQPAQTSLAPWDLALKYQIPKTSNAIVLGQTMWVQQAFSHGALRVANLLCPSFYQLVQFRLKETEENAAPPRSSKLKV